MGNSEVAVGPEDCGHGAQPVSGPLQARPQHAMQFPAELTQNACRTRSRDLRLICIYFSSTRFFQVSPCWWAMKGGCWPLPGGFAGIHVSSWPSATSASQRPSLGLRLSRIVGRHHYNVQMRLKKSSVCARVPKQEADK